MSEEQTFETSATNNTEAYEFTNDWFGGNVYEQGVIIDLRSIWKMLLENSPISTILEIGSYEGNSTCFLIEHCAKKNPIDIVCVDTWGGSSEHIAFDVNMSSVEQRFDRNIEIAKKKAIHPANVVKAKADSLTACAQMITENLSGSFDFIYVDGSHEAADVLADAILAFKLLKIGGMMVFDDYLWDFGFQLHRSTLKTPKPAIDAFTNIYYDKLRIIHGIPSYQFYIIKTAN